MTVEVFNRLMESFVVDGKIDGLCVGRQNIEITHLQFTDMLILCPAKGEMVRNVMRELKQIIRCRLEASPINYLGFPLGSNPRKVSTWQPIIGRVQKKLSGWKAKTLSKAGKTTLIKSILSSLPMYYMGIFRAPEAVIKKFEAIERKFLWSWSGDRRGIHLVSWDIVKNLRRMWIRNWGSKI